MGLINTRLPNAPLDIIQQETESSVGVPNGKTFGVVGVTICNTYDPDGVDAATRSATFNMHLLPKGKNYTTHTVETTVLRGITLDPGETYVYSESKVVMEEGEAIVFMASPDVGGGLTDLSVTLSYLEI